MGRSKGDASLSRSRKGFTVAASPFNGVKLELALILVGAVELLLIHGKLSQDALVQFSILAGYGVAAMLWLMVRVRRIARQQALVNQVSGGGDDGQA